VNPPPARGHGLATSPWARQLRAHTVGLLADTAAVDLLASHHTWLARPDFTTRFVHHTGGVAWVDWHAAATALHAGELPCSGSEADVLAIAASLGADVPVVLRDVLGRLDTTNITAVVAAVTAANGAR
jgi:hypothetical protein